MRFFRFPQNSGKKSAFVMKTSCEEEILPMRAERAKNWTFELGICQNQEQNIAIFRFRPLTNSDFFQDPSAFEKTPSRSVRCGASVFCRVTL
jgi:hypothetical protein